MSERGLKELEKKRLFGDGKIGNLEFCEDCVLGKSSRSSFRRSSKKLNERLNYAHSDLCGPVQ